MKRHHNDNAARLLTMDRVVADNIPSRRLRDVAAHNDHMAKVAASAGKTRLAARLKRQANNLYSLAHGVDAEAAA